MALQDTDNFIVGRDNESYKITYQDLKDDLNYVPPPVGTIDRPQVLSPEDGAGSGDLRSLNSDTITKVEGGGENVYTTDTIASVEATSYRVGFPQYANLGTNNPPPVMIPVAQCDLNNVQFEVRDDGEDWNFGSTGSLPGWQQYILIDQGVSRVPFIQFNQNMTGASYTLFTSDTGLANSWVFDKTIEPVNIESLYGVNAARYFVIVRNANGDSVGLTDQSQTPAFTGVAPIYFITPDVSAQTLTFPTSNNFDKFEVGDVVQDPDVKITAIDDTVPSITVDGGSWYGQDGSGDAGNPDWYQPSQEWSDLLKSGTPTYDPNGPDQGWLSPSQSASSAFDDQGLSTIAYSPFNHEWVYFIPSSPINVTSTIEFGARFTVEIKINGDDYSYTGGDTSSTQTLRSISFSGQLSEFAIRDLDNGNASTGLSLLKIDGKQLIDSSIPGGQGATNITKTVAYGTKLTVASTKDLDDMSGAVFMTDGQTNTDGTFKPASYTPQTSEIASVAINPAWNQSEVWSSKLTASNGFHSSYPASASFNGDETTRSGTNSGGTLTWDVASYNLTPSTLTVKTNGQCTVTTSKDTYIGNTDDFTVIQELLFTLDGTESLQTVSTQADASVGGDNTYGTGIVYIKMDGLMLVDTGVSGDPGAGTLLTFNTPNPDLQYFKVGDVVQHDGVTYVADVNPTDLFGDPFPAPGRIAGKNSANGAATITFTYPQPVDFTSIDGFSGGSYSMAEAYTFSFTDEQGVVTSADSTTASGWATTSLPLTPPPLVKEFTITGADGYSFGGFYSGSTYVPTGELDGGVSIIAIDIAANTR